MEALPIICRICLEYVAHDCVKFDLNAIEFNEDLLSPGAKLAACFSKLDLNITSNPITCSDCFYRIQFCYKFREKCMETETKIQAYVQANNLNSSKVDLQDVVRSLQPKIKVEEYSEELEVIDSKLVIFNAFLDNPVINQDDQNQNYPKKPNTLVEKPVMHQNDDKIPYQNCRKKIKKETAKKRKRNLLIHQNAEKLFENQERDQNYPKKIKKETCAISMTDRRYKCTECDEFSTTTKGILKTHMMIHYGIRPFKCIYCDYRCVQRQHLVVHMRRHTGEKPYKCDICSYRCRQPANLNAHMNLHKKEIDSLNL